MSSFNTTTSNTNYMRNGQIFVVQESKRTVSTFGYEHKSSLYWLDVRCTEHKSSLYWLDVRRTEHKSSLYWLDVRRTEHKSSQYWLDVRRTEHKSSLYWLVTGFKDMFN